LVGGDGVVIRGTEERSGKTGCGGNGDHTPILTLRLIIFGSRVIFFTSQQTPRGSVLVHLVPETFVGGKLGWPAFRKESATMVFPLLIETLGNEVLCLTTIVAMFYF
jgi:hypothetical protein